MASLGYRSDTEFYRIQAPQAPAGQTDVLTVSLAEMPVNGIVPVVSVFDANANPVSRRRSCSTATAPTSSRPPA